MGKLSAIGFGLAATVCAAVASAGPEDFPRTAWGKPDFSGNYDIAFLTPYTRDPKYGDSPYLDPGEASAREAGAARVVDADLQPKDNYAMFNTLRGARYLEKVWIEEHGQ